MVEEKLNEKKGILNLNSSNYIKKIIINVTHVRDT